MNLEQIETLILALQKQVQDNTAAITTLQETLSNYATLSDILPLKQNINELQQNVNTISDTLGTIKTYTDKVGYLQKLLDVKTQSLTTNDILQYGNDGRWHNVQPHMLKLTAGTSSGSGGGTLSTLTDVYLANLEDGQVLTYSEADGKWINLTPSIII